MRKCIVRLKNYKVTEVSKVILPRYVTQLFDYHCTYVADDLQRKGRCRIDTVIFTVNHNI